MGFYWVVLGFTRFYLIELGLTGFNWVLLGLFVVWEKGKTSGDGPVLWGRWCGGMRASRRAAAAGRGTG